jgi:signal transduction histidine kinase
LLNVDHLNYTELNQRWSNQLLSTSDGLAVIFKRVLGEFPADYHWRRAALVISDQRVLQLVNTETSQYAKAICSETTLPALTVAINDDSVTEELTYRTVTLEKSYWNKSNLQNWLLVRDKKVSPELKIELAQAAPTNFEATVAVPLYLLGNLYGVMLLSEKQAEFRPTKEELVNLSNIATYISTALYNNVLLNDAIAMAQEQERLRQQEELMLLHEERVREEEKFVLSEYVHDELVQDLSVIRRTIYPTLPEAAALNINNGTKKVAKAAPFDVKLYENIDLWVRPEFLERVKTNVELLDGRIAQLRDLSFDLRPIELDNELIVCIENLVKRKQDPNDQTQLVFNVIGEIADIEALLSKDVKQSIYRIIQQALNNASKHAHATCIQAEIELKFLPDRSYSVKIRIKDNGVGCEPERLVSFERLLEENHLGLANIARNFKTHGGNVKFLSAPGKGMEIVGTFVFKFDDSDDE